MINVNDIYKESEDSCLRVHKATREELESMYGKEMVKELLDGNGVTECPLDGKEISTIVGPDQKGVFEIKGVFGEHKAYINNEMLDFMIEHRAKKVKLSKPVPNQCWHCLGSGCNYYVDGGLCSYGVEK